MGLKKKNKEIMIGGQAVIEGIMMRTSDEYAIAVRTSKNKIVSKKEKFHSLTTSNKFFGLPIIRGAVILYETLVLGIKALNYSAGVELGEDVSEKNLEKGIYLTMLFSLIIAVLFFKFIPLYLASTASNLLASRFPNSNVLFNLVDGLSKIAILVLYLLAISTMKDVKRMFQYHGAEHMAVACYEAKMPLNEKNVKKFNKEHPRCGTSFITVVLIVSILFYMLIPLNYTFLAKLGIRLLLLPIIAGFSYEIIRLAGKKKNIITTIISIPGILIQKITTKKPDSSQIEVAIVSLNKVIKK